MALMVGAMTIHGITPGPQVMAERQGLFWGMIASMWIGNLMLVILNLPLIGIWVKLLSVPYRILYPAHFAVLLHWGLQPEQQRSRCRARIVLRLARLSVHQAGLRNRRRCFWVLYSDR